MTILKWCYRAFNRLFESYLWKAVVFLSILGLLLLLIYIGVTLQELAQLFSAHERPQFAPINLILNDLLPLGYVAIAFVSLLILAAFFDLRRLTIRNRNLERMIDVIREFGAGNRDRRMDTEGQRELAKAAATFNSMADTLVANIQKLEGLDASRRELMNYLAHDFGSPLTAIQGYAETIDLRNVRGTLTSEELRGFSQVILTNTKYLSGLVANLSDLSRLDEPDFRPALDKFSLSSLASDVVSRFGAMAQEKGISLSVHSEPANLSIWGDIVLLERALSNLIQNALQHCVGRGVIEVRIVRSDTQVVLTVSDNGSGIPADHLPFVFESFYRVERDRSRASGGAGLGLAITRRIVSSHGGSITVTSKPGVETRFECRFPTDGQIGMK